jgi:hypothetical protein
MLLAAVDLVCLGRLLAKLECTYLLDGMFHTYGDEEYHDPPPAPASGKKLFPAPEKKEKKLFFRLRKVPKNSAGQVDSENFD